MRPLSVLDLGLAPYEPVQALQSALRRRIATGELPGVLLLLEHPTVITLGSRGGPHDIRLRQATLPGAAPSGGRPRPTSPEPAVPIVRSERGGAATLHAPGQLVSYPVIPIPGRNLRRFVHDLEQVLVLLLAGYDVTAERRPGAPGLYVAGRKISSIGLRCERWVASHGTSLNVSVDLSLFDMIVSCGEVDLRQTSILELTGRAPVMTEVKAAYRQAFEEVFAETLRPMQRSAWENVEQALREDAKRD